MAAKQETQAVASEKPAKAPRQIQGDAPAPPLIDADLGGHTGFAGEHRHAQGATATMPTKSAQTGAHHMSWKQASTIGVGITLIVTIVSAGIWVGGVNHQLSKVKDIDALPGLATFHNLTRQRDVLISWLTDQTFLLVNEVLLVRPTQHHQTRINELQARAAQVRLLYDAEKEIIPHVFGVIEALGVIVSAKRNGEETSQQEKQDMTQALSDLREVPEGKTKAYAAAQCLLAVHDTPQVGGPLAKNRQAIEYSNKAIGAYRYLGSAYNMRAINSMAIHRDGLENGKIDGTEYLRKKEEAFSDLRLARIYGDGVTSRYKYYNNVAYYTAEALALTLDGLLSKEEVLEAFDVDGLDELMVNLDSLLLHVREISVDREVASRTSAQVYATIARAVSAWGPRGSEKAVKKDYSARAVLYYLKAREQLPEKYGAEQIQEDLDTNMFFKHLGDQYKLQLRNS